MRQKAGSPVFQVSTAPKSLKEDIRGRERRYLVSMGIRTACFVAAFITDGIARWLLIVAAVILPYIAVVIANAGRERRTTRLPDFIAPPGQAVATRSPEPPAKQNTGESV
jgi:hypothetical protein